MTTFKPQITSVGVNLTVVFAVDLLNCVFQIDQWLFLYI